MKYNYFYQIKLADLNKIKIPWFMPQTRNLLRLSKLRRFKTKENIMITDSDHYNGDYTILKIKKNNLIITK